MTSRLNGAVASELLGSTSSILVHSGNIASWSKLRRKGFLSPTDELVSTIDASFVTWLGRQGEATPGDSQEIEVKNSGLCQKVEESEKASHVFSLKVFLRSFTPKHLREAVERTLSELGLSGVHALLLAFPHPSESLLSLDLLTSIWKEAELLVKEGVAETVGVADLDKGQLEELYEWAEVKPKVNQVNLAHCCTIPEDLQEYTKSHSIKLTTHNDDRDILPDSQLADTLSSVLKDHTLNFSGWTSSWVVRYSSIINLRGIIAHKGYIVRITCGETDKDKGST